MAGGVYVGIDCFGNAVLFTLVYAICLAAIAILPVGFKFWFGVFVVAWIGQFVGHKIEGKKPSFFEDLQFLLIGPAWVANSLSEKLAKPKTS